MKWALVFVGLLCLGGVLAEEMQAYVGQTTTITTACIRNSQLRSTANATIEIFYSNGTVLVPTTQMSASGNGTFSFFYVFAEIGGYNTKETCDFSGVLADGSTLITVIKPSFGNMQVIAQGVAQVDLNKTVTSEWLLLLPNATNVSNSTVVVMGGACGVTGFDGSAVSVVPSVVTTSERMTATFLADPADGFAEGGNYQVLCNISLTDGLRVNGVKNFVYVNPHVSFWQYLLQLIGLAESTQSTVNETLLIANQTLQIVQGLNVTGGNVSGAQIYEQLPVVRLSQTDLRRGVNDSAIVARALLGSVVVTNATCVLSVYDQDLSLLVSAQNMSLVGDQYAYNWSIPQGAGGRYPAVVNCSGGSFGTATVWDSGDVEVTRLSVRAVLGK